MKNILYTVILSFLFSSSVFGDLEAGVDAFLAGDYATALKEYRAAAALGDGQAAFNIAEMYRKGEGVTEDNQEALKWYRFACENAKPDGCFEVANEYYYKKNATQDDYKKAYKFYNLTLKSASSFTGNMKKRFMASKRVKHNLAEIHQEGKGVDQDLKKARELYSTNYGFYQSQFNYAVMLYKGEGGDVNFYEAARIFKNFIQNKGYKDYESFYYLGLLYSKGHGVPLDYVIAYAFLNMAASYEINDADKKRDRLAKKMQPEKISEAQEFSRQCYLMYDYYPGNRKDCLKVFFRINEN